MKPEKLSIDFETFSALDIRKCGADVYARDPSTGAWCMAYAFDEGPVSLWVRGEPLPQAVSKHIAKGGKVVAHNAAFELAIWNFVCVPKHKWPALKLEQTICTMTMAYAMSLPGSLENASAAVGIQDRKDMVGKRIMLQLAKPKELLNDGTPVFWHESDSPPKFEALYSYCKNDVMVERELSKRIMSLSDNEREVWLLDQKINQRGISCDLPAVKAAMRIVESEQKRLDGEMQKVTSRAVSTCSAVGQLTDWIEQHGVKLEGVAKSDVTELLSQKDLPAEVEAALKLRQEAAKSSTAKLKSMLVSTCTDGRLRGLFQYHGAGTGRWAGRRLQVQNFPRGNLKPKEVSEILDALPHGLNASDIDLFYGEPLTALSDCLRGFLRAASGHELIAADFSAIEARVLAWLAGEKKVLDIFATHGKIYEHAAAGIYKVPMESVTKAQRQIGKTAVLALGYGGGVKAFQTMAKNFGIQIGDDEAEKIKLAWRDTNQNIVRYWHALERAAMRAVSTEGQNIRVTLDKNPIIYLKKGSFLWCRLPSGRTICYPYAKIETIHTPWGEAKQGLTYMSESSQSRKFEKHKAYGGLLAENITQAVSRDLLAEAMIRLEARGYPVVLHCHDEAVVEVKKGAGSLKEVESIMAETPSWAQGLPLAAEGWAGSRYRK